MIGDPREAVVRLMALVPALVLHEFAHGYSAYRMGDPTPKAQGRLTLNPLAHLDPIGTLMIIFAPIGWAKPVQVNPYNFRDPAKGMMISTACGPLSNIAQAIFWGLILRVLIVANMDNLEFLEGNILVAFLAMAVLINFVLALFNLIPLGPLDGHHILQYFLPYRRQVEYTHFNRQYGMIMLVVLLAIPYVFDGPNILAYIVFYPAVFLGSMVIGWPLYGVLGAGLGI